MIITVTLNPAVDKTINIENFKLGSLNRVKKIRKDAGGKGINVSKVVAELGGKTTALGFLGGTTGEFIKNELAGLEFNSDFIVVEKETRTNLKIIDKSQRKETEINEAGAEVTVAELEQLEERLLKTANLGDSVVLTGSLPPGVPDDIYKQLIKRLNSKEIKVFLDASGNSLKQGLVSNPFLIKPNLVELEFLVERNLETEKEIVDVAQEIQQQGIRIVVVSLGDSGVVVVSGGSCFKVLPPQVEVNSTIAAGDTLVGALALKLEEGCNLKQAIRFATAASVSTVTKIGTKICNRKEVQRLLKQVEIVKL
ncbi:MAG: 1-phosphofructokinase [Bacillota bacterium]